MSKTYNADSIQVYRDIEAVRIRPGMYIGDIATATFQMLCEVVDNSVDEFLAGYCKTIEITVDEEGFEVSDDGRGIPIDMHTTEKVSALELILTTLHSGGKFNSESYQYSSGLHGVGVSVVNALSDYLKVDVYREGFKYTMTFAKGKVVQQITQESCDKNLRGTKIYFKPDFSIVEQTFPTKDIILRRLRDLCYLNSGIKFIFTDKREKIGDEFFTKTLYSEEGLVEFLKDSLDNKNVIGKVLHFRGPRINTAFCWCEGRIDKNLCFTNSIFQNEGGTHLAGFKTALTKVVLDYYRKVVKGKIEITGEDVRASFVSILSINLEDPQFSSQTKNRLVSLEARSLVENFLSEKLNSWFEENPLDAKKIIKKVMENAEERLALNSVRDNFKKKELDSIAGLAGKLSDCQSRDPKEKEIFIVEGDSAGGSAKQGRNRRFQAILPIRGKLLNVERATYKKVLDCEEILSLLAALGTGIGDNFNIANLKFHKIIIMTDADVDGLHIFSLLVTFFAKFLPDVIVQGHLYVSRSPLYKISSGPNVTYLYNDENLENFLFERFFNKSEIKSISGEVLNKEKVKSLVNYCLKFRKDWTNSVDNNILRVASASGIFQNRQKFIDSSTKLFGETGVEDKEEGKLAIKIKNIYGVNLFVYDFVRDLSTDLLPIYLNGKFFADPVDFLDEMRRVSHLGINLSRFKGLGEMDAEELSITSLDPKKRTMDLVTMDSEVVTESLARIADIMGDELDRREFVLSNIKQMFGLAEE